MNEEGLFAQTIRYGEVELVSDTGYKVDSLCGATLVCYTPAVPNLRYPIDPEAALYCSSTEVTFGGPGQSHNEVLMRPPQSVLKLLLNRNSSHDYIREYKPIP